MIRLREQLIHGNQTRVAYSGGTVLYRVIWEPVFFDNKLTGSNDRAFLAFGHGWFRLA